MDTKKLAETLHPLERAVLPVLVKSSSFDEIVKASKLKEVEVMRALQWLSNKKIIDLKTDLKEVVELDKNGLKYTEKGLPEMLFAEAIKEKPLTLDEVANKADLEKQEINICIGMLKGKAAILFDKGKLSLTPNGEKFLKSETLEEKFLKKLSQDPIELKTLSDEEKFAFDSLKKRKDIIKTTITKIRTAELTALGKKLSKEKIATDVIDSLTPEMLEKGTWKNKKFRRYDIEINVPRISGGKQHFVNQTVDYIKKIWLELGFKEMQGTHIQTAFWDLDALFVPQDHPARQMQDTFYIKNPKSGKLPPIYKKVKEVHEDGADTCSKGWQTPWSEEVAKRNLLRTHTTVLSAKTLSGLKESDLPAKFFSVGKVFRNEALDWSHLFEFYQVEGIVVDPDANLKNLKGYLKEFFGKMGYPDVRMRPAHFPYTEPSVEVDVWHPVKKTWVELGGSGIFRPELTKPLMGFECPVLAWGLGLPRTVSGYFNITDIRDLYRNDLKQIREMKHWMM